MTRKLEVYKCEICGNMVEMVHEGKGQLVCCGKPMVLMEENSVDAAKEKHVPVLEKIDKGYKVRVGTAAHPMEDKHYIEWIELIAGDVSQRVFLRPGQEPEASFCTDASTVTARAYCNLHGLWRS